VQKFQGLKRKKLAMNSDLDMKNEKRVVGHCQSILVLCNSYSVLMLSQDIFKNIFYLIIWQLKEIIIRKAAIKYMDENCICFRL
jgi:hypothetical protein